MNIIGTNTGTKGTGSTSTNAYGITQSSQIEFSLTDSDNADSTCTGTDYTGMGTDVTGTENESSSLIFIDIF